jgi:hypothetical protein
MWRHVNRYKFTESRRKVCLHILDISASCTENAGSTSFRNIGKYPPNYTAWRPWILYSSKISRPAKMFMRARARTHARTHTIFYESSECLSKLNCNSSSQITFALRSGWSDELARLRSARKCYQTSRGGHSNKQAVSVDETVGSAYLWNVVHTACTTNTIYDPTWT